jgi:hypothetical protein
MNGELDRLDAAIVDMVATLELAGIRIGAERDGSAVTLTGTVDSREDRQAVFDVARATLMRAGARVVDAIEIPDERDEQERNEQAGRSSGQFAWTGAPDDLPRSADFTVAEFDPDFTDDAGATDPMVAAAEGVPWFPPTDPVVGPSDDDGDLRMLNGFAATGDAPDVPPGAPALDELLNARVLRALADDALTTDLAITAHTRGGVVHLRGEAPTLEDGENAEAVAASVEGVNEVGESLRVGSIRDRA